MPRSVPIAAVAGAMAWLGMSTSGMAQGFPFSDNFESYAVGTWPCTTPGCVGPGGWGLWFYTYGNGPRPASITTGIAHSGSKAVRLSPYSDVVKRGNITSGRWRITVQTYFPSGLTGANDSGYFILLNECTPEPPVSFSMLLLFEGASGLVKNNSYPEMTPVALVRDRWAPVRVDIDLDANRHSAWYNGQLLFANRTYPPSGRRALECVAFYSDGVDGMLFDTISVQRVNPPCYANCDGSTTAPVLNVADFTCFMQRFSAGQGYANCDGSTTAPVLNIQDLLCFMDRYQAGCGG